MEKKNDVPKATRVAMREIMGMDEIKSTFMSAKGAAKVEGTKTIGEDVLKKINGKRQ